MQSAIYEGHVRHRRFLPSRHAFRSSLFMMYLDLDELPSMFKGRWFWSVEKTNLATFRRRDHVGDPTSSLATTIRDLVESEISSRPPGPIRLLTHLSYLGYCFNPLSVFFCFDDTGTRLHSVVAEVTNTPWGERHCYVLDASQAHAPTDASAPGSSAPATVMKQTFSFPKNFHVSPFMQMDVEYRWTLSGPAESLVLHTENLRDGESFFDATLVLNRREITAWSLANVLVRHPLMTVQVIANIYWQAMWLWWKKVPYVPHPKTCQTDVADKNSDTLKTSRVTPMK